MQYPVTPNIVRIVKIFPTITIALKKINKKKKKKKQTSGRFNKQTNVLKKKKPFTHA
jgi:hypothetical protein